MSLRSWPRAKSFALFLGGLVALLFELVAHLIDESRSTTKLSYRTLRRLYAGTRGKSAIVLEFVYRVLRPPTRIKRDQRADALASQVRDSGFCVDEAFVDPVTVTQLRNFLQTLTPATTSTVRHDYLPTDLIRSPIIQALVQNPLLLRTAANYLRSVPILAGIAAWKSFCDDQATQDDYSRAAQLFHYDADWVRFVKFFIYLTDVSDLDGPFSIVRGTHKTKPSWQDRRFSEKEILVDFGLAKDEHRIIGPAGTLIVADTSALHRGSPVLVGPRLILQFEYSVSRLGASGQYPLLPASLKPLEPHRNMFALFSGI